MTKTDSHVQANSYVRSRFNIRGLFENFPTTQEGKAKLVKHAVKWNLLQVVWQLDLEDACFVIFLIGDNRKNSRPTYHPNGSTQLKAWSHTILY